MSRKKITSKQTKKIYIYIYIYGHRTKKRQFKRKKNKKREREREKHGQSPCATAHGHFRPKMIHNFSLQFSLHFGKKKLFGMPKEKISRPRHLFSHPTKYIPKKFPFPFSLQSFPSTIFHLLTNTPLRNEKRSLPLPFFPFYTL